jgi:hypothetical protein
MHKARALANVYFWNKWYRQQGLEKRFENHCPDEWALEIISEDEFLVLFGSCSKIRKLLTASITTAKNNDLPNGMI